MTSKQIVQKSPSSKKESVVQISKAKAKAKAKAKTKVKARTDLKSDTISADERLKMISEAAYYLAEKHGFDPNNKTQDWLEAESMVEAALSESRLSYNETSH